MTNQVKTQSAGPWIWNGKWYYAIPDPLPIGQGSLSGATEADFMAQGARLATQEEIDAKTAAEAAEAAEAASEALKRLQEIAPVAHVFRIVMERNFGVGACTNQDLTFSVVQSYFVQKLLSGTITQLETADSVYLQATFPILIEYTGDGTIWSIPWELIP